MWRRTTENVQSPEDYFPEERGRTSQYRKLTKQKKNERREKKITAVAKKIEEMGPRDSLGRPLFSILHLVISGRGL